MSRKSLAKTYSDYVMDWFREYRRAHDGPVRIEDVVKMCLDEGHLDRNPKVDPQRWYPGYSSKQYVGDISAISKNVLYANS